MYVSGAGQPVTRSDAFPLLLDRVLRGGDVILISDGREESNLMDRAATRLATLRSRVVRASDVLPNGGLTSMVSQDMVGRLRLSNPDDEFLTQSYRSLTVLDETCDRIVLLIDNAHALQHSALRYIQFVSRSCGHLKLVICGAPGFLGLLEVERLAWLRTRLLKGLVLTLGTPITRVSTQSAAVPIVTNIRRPRVGKAAALWPLVSKPEFSSSMSSRNVRLVPLVFFGLGGAAWLMLCLQNEATTRPSTDRQDLVQRTTSKQLVTLAPSTKIIGHSVILARPEKGQLALDASALHSSEITDDTRGTGSASMSSRPVASPSTMISKDVFPIHPENRSVAIRPSFVKMLASAASSNLGDRRVSAASQHASDASAIDLPTSTQPMIPTTRTKRATGLAVSRTVANTLLAETEADVHPVVVTGSGKSANSEPSPSISALSSSGAAPSIVVAALPQNETGPLSDPSKLRWREAFPAADSSWRRMSTIPSHTGVTPGRQARRFKLLAKRVTPSAADVPWLAPQPVSSAGDGSQRYIGSYATDANGVRVFRPDP